MTSLTLVTAAVIVYGLVGRRGYGRALALGGVTPIGAALAAGTLAIPTFYAVALGVPLGLVASILGKPRRDPGATLARIPGLLWLILFLVWGVLVTLLAPQLFNGTSVLLPAGGTGTLSASGLTTSNIAQMIYLALGVGVVWFLARSPSTRVELVGLATGGATLLSLWAYAHQFLHVPFPVGFFDNSPAFAFVNTLPGGAPRFRGIFSEPAGLAVSSLVTIAYMASRATQVTGLRRVGAVLVLAAAVLLASVSTSATFVVAGVVIVVLAAGVFIVRFALQRMRLSPLVGLAGCALAIAALWLLPIAAALIQQVVDDKVGSASYDSRSGADNQAYALVFRTLGFGVGLGSTRPSSFFAALLVSTGVVGALLFAAAVATILIRSASVTAVRPAAWALVALLVTKVISSPDLSDTSGVLWISLGVLAHAVTTRPASTTVPGLATPVAIDLSGSRSRRGAMRSPARS